MAQWMKRAVSVDPLLPLGHCGRGRSSAYSHYGFCFCCRRNAPSLDSGPPPRPSPACPAFVLSVHSIYRERTSASAHTHRTYLTPPAASDVARLTSLRRELNQGRGSLPSHSAPLRDLPDTHLLLSSLTSVFLFAHSSSRPLPPRNVSPPRPGPPDSTPRPDPDLWSLLELACRLWDYDSDTKRPSQPTAWSWDRCIRRRSTISHEQHNEPSTRVCTVSDII